MDSRVHSFRLSGRCFSDTSSILARCGLISWSQDMNPTVSAIIPTYNRADLLARALDSLIAQDYRPLEAVVIDDGSTDHTPRIIEAYRHKLRGQGVNFIFHRQQNGRAPKARNVGMQLATGPLLAFLDSDDLWLPQFCSALVHLLEKFPSAGLAFSGIHVIDNQD